MAIKDGGKIIRLAEEKKMTPREFCQCLVDEHGSDLKAAMTIGVYPNAIRYHLGKNKKSAKVQGEAQ